MESEEGEFQIIVDPKYKEGLKELEHFIVIFCSHKVETRETQCVSFVVWREKA
ncbi:MAG: hypothetical protein QW279_16400 [Candidatus Jordarchaeaceae archaeon]